MYPSAIVCFDATTGAHVILCHTMVCLFYTVDPIVGQANILQIKINFNTTENFMRTCDARRIVMKQVGAYKKAIRFGMAKVYTFSNACSKV